MQKVKLNELLSGWFKGTGKPNSIDGKCSIHQVIRYREIMGNSHHRLIAVILGEEFNNKLSRREKGELKQLKRALKIR